MRTLPTPQRRRLPADRRGVAMLEFAIIAPVMVIMATAGFDVTRALVTWQEVETSAEWAAVSAQSLAVNTTALGAETTLTTQQATVAMTTMYGSMPQVFSGLWSGKYAIAMSGVQWYYVAGVAKPFLAWTTTLQGLAPSEVRTSQWDGTFLRTCSAPATPLVQVVTVPNDASVLTTVPTENIGKPATFVVIDMHYHFVPILPGLDFLTGSIDFYTSFSFPNLIGENNQPLIFDGNAVDGWNCQGLPNTPVMP
jgi:Flp pilus assembly protein TadG